MGKIPGYKIVLQLDSKTIVGYRSHTMTDEVDMAEATTGASTNQRKEYVPMFKGMEFSVEGLYDPVSGGNLSLDDVWDLLDGGTQFTAKWGGIETGDRYYQASSYVRRINKNAPHDTLSDYTVDCIVDGDVTHGTV